MVKSLIYKRVGVAQKDDLWDVDAIHERLYLVCLWWKSHFMERRWNRGNSGLQR